MGDGRRINLKDGRFRVGSHKYKKDSAAPSGRRAAVTIEDDRTGYRYPAIMRACHAGGICLESRYAPRPGSKLHVLFHPGAHRAEACACAAVIVSRRLLRGLGSGWSYGLGIEFA
jgi:hypothetical protein